MHSIIIVAFASFSLAIAQTVLYTADATVNEYKEQRAELFCQVHPKECGQ